MYENIICNKYANCKKSYEIRLDKIPLTIWNEQIHSELILCKNARELSENIYKIILKPIFKELEMIGFKPYRTTSIKKNKRMKARYGKQTYFVHKNEVTRLQCFFGVPNKINDLFRLNEIMKWHRKWPAHIRLTVEGYPNSEKYIQHEKIIRKIDKVFQRLKLIKYKLGGLSEKTEIAYDFSNEYDFRYYSKHLLPPYSRTMAWEHYSEGNFKNGYSEEMKTNNLRKSINPNKSKEVTTYIDIRPNNNKNRIELKLSTSEIRRMKKSLTDLVIHKEKVIQEKAQFWEINAEELFKAKVNYRKLGRFSKYHRATKKETLRN